MKNKIWILPLVLIGLVLIFTNSCKKDKIIEPEPIEEPPAPTITADKVSVNQLEIVSLIPTNITFNQTQYTGSIGGQNANILLSDNKLVFIVPDIPAGTQTLTTTIEGVAYSIPFSIIQVAAVSDPVVYYNNYSSDLATQTSDLQNYINQMSGIIDVGVATQDMQTIQNYINTSTQNFQNASVSEKAAAIKFLEANQPWLNEIKLSLDTLNTSINDLVNAKNSKSYKDYEAMAKKAYFDFRNAVMQVRSGIALVAIAVPFMIPPFTFIGAVVVGAAVGNLLADVVNVLTKEEQLINSALSVNDLISEGNKSNPVFSNNISQPFIIDGTYRNIYNIDKNSNVSMVASFVSSMQSLSSGLSFINSKLPNKLQMTTKIIDNLTTKKTTDVTVHAKYLSIANISNSKVTGNAQNNNGEFVLTFQTNETTDQNFNFNIVYNNNGGVTNSISVTGATLIPITTLSLTTNAPDFITTSSAYIGGIINFDGGLPITDRGVCWSTSPNPTVANNYFSVGIGDFNYTINGLPMNTVYYARAYATNSNGTAYGNQVSFTTNGTVIDYDGNIYNTVTIGNQTWMVENLKTTHYKTGAAINFVSDSAWVSSSGSYCNYDNNPSNSNVYGRLYNFGAVSFSNNLSPQGWHIPSLTECQNLVAHLGGDSIAGGKLKETGYSHWDSPNTGATNITGFTAIPGGYRSIAVSNTNFYNMGWYGNFWTSTLSGGSNPYYMKILYNEKKAIIGLTMKEFGYSVRCIQDAKR